MKYLPPVVFYSMTLLEYLNKKVSFRINILQNTKLSFEPKFSLIGSILCQLSFFFHIWIDQLKRV